MANSLLIDRKYTALKASVQKGGLKWSLVGGRMICKKSQRENRMHGLVYEAKTCCNKQSGFTLIELLVVVAIISLLVSILLPSLQKARDLAKATVCLSNLHQNGLVLSMYANDNNGSFPQAWNGREWVYTLQASEYLSQTPNVVCPAYPPYKWGEYRNWYGLRYPGNMEPAGDYKTIEYPSNYALVADSISDAIPVYGQQWYFIHYPGGSFYKFHTRHFSKANIDFADGSARALEENEILELGDGWRLSSIFTE